MTVKLVTIPDVELAAVGDWPTEKGWGRFTADDLASMAVHAGAAERGFNPRIKLGHGSTGLGAVPAWGRVENVRVVGDKLIGDLTHVPQPLASVMPSALPGRSIEAVRGRKGAGGESIPMVMTGLALLGVEEPAIDSLADLHAAMVGETDLVIHAAASLAGLSVEAFEASLLSVVDSAGDEPATEEHTVSDETTTPDEKPDAAPVEAPENPTEAPNAAPEGDEAPAKTEEPAEVKLPEGVVPIDAARLAKLEARLVELEAAQEEQVAAGRDSYIEAAIGAGKFAPAQRDTYATLLEQAPDATKALIDAMTVQTIPVHAERGHAGDPETLDDVALAAYEARYGKEA